MGSFLGILRDAYLQSDVIGRGIVILLIVASAVSWAIMIDKALVVKSFARRTKKFIQAFDKSGSALSVGYHLDASAGPLEAVCKAGFDSLMELLDVQPSDQEHFLRKGILPRPLRALEIEKIRTAMERSLNQQRTEAMDRMVWLGTIVSLSPYCGLLGTVWGVMMTFVQLAAQQGKKPDLGQLAPGVSGALLTTVAGLVVAIPAVLGNNLIISSIDDTCASMDAFVNDFLARLRLEEVPEDGGGED